MRRLLPAALALALAVVPVSALSEADGQALKALDQAYARAWLGDDAASRVMALFAEGATIVPHHGASPVTGKKAIKEFFWPDGPPTKVTKFERRPAEVGGNETFGYVRGRFTLEFSFEQNGKPVTFSNEGNYLLVAMKTGRGEWRIKQLIWNDPVPRQDS